MSLGSSQLLQGNKFVATLLETLDNFTDETSKEIFKNKNNKILTVELHQA